MFRLLQAEDLNHWELQTPPDVHPIPLPSQAQPGLQVCRANNNSRAARSTDQPPREWQGERGGGAGAQPGEEEQQELSPEPGAGTAWISDPQGLFQPKWFRDPTRPGSCSSPLASTDPREEDGEAPWEGVTSGSGGG